MGKQKFTAKSVTSKLGVAIKNIDKLKDEEGRFATLDALAEKIVAEANYQISKMETRGLRAKQREEADAAEAERVKKQEAAAEKARNDAEKVAEARGKQIQAEKALDEANESGDKKAITKAEKDLEKANAAMDELTASDEKEGA